MPMCALLQTWNYSNSRDKDNRGGEDVNKAIKCRVADDNKSRSLVTKRVVNVKYDVHRPDNRSSRIA